MGLQRVLGIEVQPLTSSLALGLLLSRKTELKPLRVYGEQAEATEFPLPGVSSRSILTKTSQEGRPNQSLRYTTHPSVLGLKQGDLHWTGFHQGSAS